MTELISVPQPQRDPGVANAEDGVVILDGPDGVAVTMTADAATQTGNSLISAAAIARVQLNDNDATNDP
ncbi:hypothetical protein ACFB49_26600 [Sphingomonas sp. DBB INV C78]|uniref:hypothetical protein n=1 Tax=Sphingomonas sp. DBB INV C78 TaxID=3349434 RepID=UPI0036D2C17D